MCQNCHKKLFSDIHSCLENEFLNLNIEVKDDEKTIKARLDLNKEYSIKNLINLGNALCFQERHKEATKFYLLALKLDKNNYLAHRKLGLCYLKNLKFKEAKNEFEICLKVTNDKLDVLYRIGLCNFYLKDYKNSKLIFSECINLSINNIPMLIASKYWLLLSSLKLKEDIKVKVEEENIEHHLGYYLFIKYFNEKIELSNFKLNEIDDTCLNYGLYCLSNEKSYLDKALKNKLYYGSFAYIAAFNEFKNLN